MTRCYAFARIAILLSLSTVSPGTAVADSQHMHEGMHAAGTNDSSGTTPGHGGSSAWADIRGIRDAIAADLDAGKLAGIHPRAERLAPLAAALRTGAKDLPPETRARIEGALKQVPSVADALHTAADAGQVDSTRRALKRLDGILDLVQAQFPAELLPAIPAPAEGNQGAAAPGVMQDQATHVHAARPLAAVDDPAAASISVMAGDFTFAPKKLSMRAGAPTRLELKNDGAVEHALVVRAPNGAGDWIHLHAQPKGVDAATYRIDHPGTYRVLCTIAGHTEAGMVGELVVR